MDDHRARTVLKGTITTPEQDRGKKTLNDRVPDFGGLDPKNSGPATPASNTQDIDQAYQKNLPMLRHYIHNLMNKNHDTSHVDDIMQDVYLRALSSKKNEKLTYAKAYLFRIARNLTFKSNAKKSYHVKRLVEDFAAEGVIDNVVPQDEQLYQKRRLTIFFEAVSCLPPQCRQVFTLRQIDGLSHQEISQRLGISTSTVEKHLAKGLRLSAQYMTRCGYDEQSLKRESLPKEAAE